MTDDLSFLVGSHGHDNFKGLINYEDVTTQCSLNIMSKVNINQLSKV